MNLKKTILLDLDGVLIDMVVPLMQWWGVRITGEAQYPRDFGWDVKGAISYALEIQGRRNKSKTVHDMSRKEFWHTMPYSFWRDLLPYPTVDAFVRFLEQQGLDIYFMTAHANPDCASAKLNWINDYFPRYWDRVLVGHPKHLAANSQSILIDDSDKNCDDFIAAGGLAILCPRPWNRRWGESRGFNSCPEPRPLEHDTVIKNLYEIAERL